MTGLTRLLLLLLVGVISVTVVAYSRLGAFLFARGSDTTLTVIRAPLLALLLLEAGMVLIVVAVSFTRSPRLTGGAALFLLALWAIGGRTVGVFADGRIVSGWFFLRTSALDFRDPGEDPETYVAKVTVVPAVGWFIEVWAPRGHARLFIGPVGYRATIALLATRGFNVVRKTPGH